MGLADEIEKLNTLWERGAISDEEFQQAKQKLLQEQQSAGDAFSKSVRDFSSNENSWSMFIHLSQFFHVVVPLAGLIVPIVLWQIKKDESNVIDQHGRIVANWIITEFILAILFAVLTVVVVGFPLFIGLIVVGLIFPVIGAVKANNGEVWPYPFSIRFFSLDLYHNPYRDSYDDPYDDRRDDFDDDRYGDWR